LTALTKVVKYEYSEVVCHAIDLIVEPSEIDLYSFANCLSLVDNNTGEHNDTITLIRFGQCFSERLVSLKRGDFSARTDIDTAWRMTPSDDGRLDNLSVENVFIEPLGDTDVRVAVEASALNFRDVLNALGMLQAHALEMGLGEFSMPPGFDFSGRVVAVGSKVTRCSLGDSVFGVASGSMGSQVVASEQYVCMQPDVLSMAESSALPTVYITAFYALHTLANIKAGDSILIQAGAGGVGLAAIAIAKKIGAKIYSTASHSKRAYLKAQGVDHVMDSRALDFREEILELSNGKGVDIVLNSLNRDWIEASVDCLADTGRFIEIGKIGVWDDEQFKQKKPNGQYFVFD
ncbi:MAG: zinc-binding dehydrogenase, partial [Psychrosphaera sp.]|nr:zinc-binding dehydrogenase [Psychrosphaera sp.]